MVPSGASAGGAGRVPLDQISAGAVMLETLIIYLELLSHISQPLYDKHTHGDAHTDYSLSWVRKHLPQVKSMWVDIYT